MVFHNVMFLPSEASFSTTFLKNDGRGECLWTATCLKIMVGGRQWDDPCEILSLQQSLFLCNLNFLEII